MTGWVAREATQAATLAGKRTVNVWILFRKSDFRDFRGFQNRIQIFTVRLPAKVAVWVAPRATQPVTLPSKRKVKFPYPCREVDLRGNQLLDMDLGNLLSVYSAR